MAYVRECPKCGNYMIEYSARKHYALVVNSDREIEGIRECTSRVLICKNCKHSEVESTEKIIKLPVKLPKEFIYAIAEEILSYIYHKL